MTTLDAWSYLDWSIKGVKYFEGILGAETLIMPWFISYDRSEGDIPSLGAANIVPGASLPYWNDEVLSYWPGPTQGF